MSYEISLLGEIKLCRLGLVEKHRPKIPKRGLMLTRIGGLLRTCGFNFESTTEFLEYNQAYGCVVGVITETSDFRSELCSLPASIEIVSGDWILAVGKVTQVAGVEKVAF